MIRAELGCNTHPSTLHVLVATTKPRPGPRKRAAHAAVLVVSVGVSVRFCDATAKKAGCALKKAGGHSNIPGRTQASLVCCCSHACKQASRRVAGTASLPNRMLLPFAWCLSRHKKVACICCAGAAEEQAAAAQSTCGSAPMQQDAAP